MITFSESVKKIAKKSTKTQATQVSDQENLILPSRHISPVNGWGYCTASGCNCTEFEGSGYTCSNCGHHYDYHS